MNEVERSKLKLQLKLAQEMYNQIKANLKEIRIFLGAENSGAELDSRKTVLEEFKAKKIIARYSSKIVQQEEPIEPNIYEAGLNHDAYKQYKDDLVNFRSNKEKFNAEFRWGIIARSDVNLLNLKKLLARHGLVEPGFYKKIKIEFIGDSLIDIENDVLLIRYKHKNEGYTFLNYFYNQVDNFGEPVYWEEIANALAGEKSALHSSGNVPPGEQDYQRSVYDVFNGINKLAVQKLKRKIVEIEGKNYYTPIL